MVFNEGVIEVDVIDNTTISVSSGIISANIKETVLSVDFKAPPSININEAIIGVEI